MKCSLLSVPYFLPTIGFFILVSVSLPAQTGKTSNSSRERISLNEGWRFMKYTEEPDTLIYDERPIVGYRNDNIVADTRATDTGKAASSKSVLKAWILPTANDFIKDTTKRYQRPAGNPGQNFPFVKNDFNDVGWEAVSLPHDWAIKGPFYEGEKPIVGGGMGRLPLQGVAWYRRKLNLSTNDKDKEIYLDIDGAMSYAMVWLNGILVGGWPYGYNSFRLNLTPYMKFGSDNQLAIRIDNPNNSARWYPGGGIYRNMWLTKTAPIHVAHWGTFIRTTKVSTSVATLDLTVQVQNNSTTVQKTQVITSIYPLNADGRYNVRAVAVFPQQTATIAAGFTTVLGNTFSLKKPALWGLTSTQKPNLYIAITTLLQDGKVIDTYETRFGIRSIECHPTKGVLVNGQPVRLQGVNQHHDLGALGAAWNTRAAERQLEILKEMGCNAIRLSHNPPAPELLDLCDRMGFLVIDEIFDCWERGKTPLDFHLIFADWSEADVRSFLRRDRNHPSIMAWSFGNEVGEQYTADSGAAVAKRLYSIVKEEDSTRPAIASMNYAKPDMPFPRQLDLISLNYQGEGIRDAPAYSHLKGIHTSPLYPAFQKAFPNKMIYSSESASALSTRGTYIFPVAAGNSAPVGDSTGGDPTHAAVSAYELYTAAFGSSADKVFATQDKNPYVAGEFVWSGWDYLGEPTPYYTARSSYSGIIDLAGFRKDRFYLYQSRWMPKLPIAHILPHWTWPGREGQITPVHIFTSGDEAELFVNGKSAGRKKKAAFEYRLRWDSVQYQPGELKIVAYKNGKQWAIDTVQTAGTAAKLDVTADRKVIQADGKDLSFITVRVLDANKNLVPNADNNIQCEISGPGEILATDNGNPADFTPFPSAKRKAYSGLLLVIVRSKKGQIGTIKLIAKSTSLSTAQIEFPAE